MVFIKFTVDGTYEFEYYVLSIVSLKCTLCNVQVQDQFCSIKSYIRTLCLSQFETIIDSCFVVQRVKGQFTVAVCDHVLKRYDEHLQS